MSFGTGSWERRDWHSSSPTSEPHWYVLRGRSAQAVEALMMCSAILPSLRDIIVTWLSLEAVMTCFLILAASHGHYHHLAAMNRDHLYSCHVWHSWWWLWLALYVLDIDLYHEPGTRTRFQNSLPGSKSGQLVPIFWHWLLIKTDKNRTSCSFCGDVLYCSGV